MRLNKFYIRNFLKKKLFSNCFFFFLDLKILIEVRASTTNCCLYDDLGNIFIGAPTRNR